MNTAWEKNIWKHGGSTVLTSNTLILLVQLVIALPQCRQVCRAGGAVEGPSPLEALEGAQ